MRYQEWTQKIEHIIRLFYSIGNFDKCGRTEGSSQDNLRSRFSCIQGRKYKLKAWAACVFAAAWWGILYPELCFTEETCQAVMTADGEDAGKQSDVQQMVSQQITYKDILEATGDDVVVKSRFLEWLEECMRDFSE